MTPAEFEELTKFAEFGRLTVELAKEHGLVPKRVKARIRVVERVKIVARRARRTNAQIEADRAIQGVLDRTKGTDPD